MSALVAQTIIKSTITGSVRDASASGVQGARVTAERDSTYDLSALVKGFIYQRPDIRSKICVSHLLARVVYPVSVEKQQVRSSFGLAHQIGTVEYSRSRRFRAMLEQWLAGIRVIWPECPARISPDGQSILVAQGTSILPTEARYA
jgi:hypothetical protein